MIDTAMECSQACGCNNAPQAEYTGVPPTAAAAQARAYFPRGLEQPEGSFRFSIDALLLAAFSPGERCKHFIELGTGCGVISIAACLRHAQLCGIGFEQNARLAAAANRNASRLGLEKRFQAVHGAVETTRLGMPLTPATDTPMPPEQNPVSEQNPAQGRHDISNKAAPSTLFSTDLVMANPPWRKSGSGRPPQCEDRQAALVDPGTALDAFCAAAGRVLTHKGFFTCVYDAARLTELLAATRRHGLEAKRLRFVHGRKELPARLVLLEARKQARPDLKVEPPLILYDQKTQEKNKLPFTVQALEFCPFLACNAIGT